AVSAATTLLTALVVVPGQAAAPDGVTVQVACTAPAWAEGNTYTAGQQVTYQGRLYQALVTHTAWPGAGWNPASTPSLWTDLGACTGTPPSASASPSRPPSASPTPSRSPSRSPSASPTPS